MQGEFPAVLAILFGRFACGLDDVRGQSGQLETGRIITTGVAERDVRATGTENTEESK